MRKHASSWLIKVILGAIIVTFVFFFGYTSFSRGMRGGRVGAEGNVAAKVDKTSISASEFDFFYNQNYERLKTQFQGQEIPDFARKFAQSSTLQQLVGREVILQQADTLGINIPDSELADTIKQYQTPPNGEFDPIAYRHNFLPYFKQHYGMDYEQLVKQDLRISVFNKLFSAVDKNLPIVNTNGDGKEITWTFETVTIDPEALVNSKTLRDPDDAMSLAKTLIATDPKGWANSLKPLKIEPKKVGPIKISERKMLLDGKGSFEDYGKIFGLSKERPIVDEPVQFSGKIYVVRLADKTEKEVKDSTLPEAGDFLQMWISKVVAKAKVQSFLEKQ